MQRTGTAWTSRGPRTIATSIRKTLDRVIVAVRIAAAVYDVALIAATDHRYHRPWLGIAVAVSIAGWTALASRWQLRRPFARTTTPRQAAIVFVVADVTVVMVLTLATRLVQTHTQIAGGMSTLTTVWAVAPTLTAGARGGIAAGIVAAALQGLSSVVVRGAADGATAANVVLLGFAACATGYVARLASQADAVTRHLVAQQAREQEREKLARDIHDGVLQVLSYVHRRGAEIGGATAELARVAGEQETRLRSLVNTAGDRNDADVRPGGADLCAELGRLRAQDVTISTPGGALVVPGHTATELAAAVAAALDNVRRHAGPDAQAWVLLEDEGDHVIVSVRDAGVGIAPGRLDQAATTARMGVSKSIVGRVRDLGGSVSVNAAPGGGTEVEMTVPLPKGART